MNITCPLCNQPDPLYSKKRQIYICEDCGHEFAPEEQFIPQRIFISYGHDEHVSLAIQLRDDLRERGHEVWFDKERLKPGSDFEIYIEEGLKWAAEGKPHAAVILLLTPHSVRRPEGYCLNEVARALMLNLRIIPLMVVESEPPLSICRIQWLDMRECIPIHEKKDLYEPRFQRLLMALEKEKLDYEGLQSRLLRTLKPIEFSADLFKLLRDFTGRKWVFDEIDAWFKNPAGPKLFWLTGAPGVGKSAVAAWVREHRREIAAYHFCDINSEEKRNPAKLVCSIAYQLSTQLPEYQERLGRLDLENIVQEYHEAYTLFDKLLVQPLSEGYPAPDRTIVVLIDALDEATSDSRNEIVRLLKRSADKTPPWLRFFVTSRPEPEIKAELQALKPYELDTTREENLADLKEYITKQIPAATPEQAEEIIKRSEGLFLYVSHVAAAIREKTLDLERIEDFPRNLGEVYYQFFDRQFGHSLTDYEDKIIPLLQVILAALEPLSKKEIKEICKIATATELERRLNHLGSLFPATGEGDKETIRPFHYSISEWITDRGAAGHYVVALSDGHEVLAEYCWQQYLSGVEALSPYALQFLPAHLVAAKRFDDLIGDEQNPGPLTDLSFVQAKIQTETNAVIKIFRAVDLCAFAIKILVAHQLKMMVNCILEDETKKAVAQNIQRMIQFHFQRPTLGHWVSLLHDLQRLELYPERRLNVQLKNASISLYKIVEIRNRYAHSIFPTHDQANEEYCAIINHMEALLVFLSRNKLYEVITDIGAITPLLNSIQEDYNRAKSRKDSKISCDILDCFSGKRIVGLTESHLNDYLKSILT